MPRGRRLYVRNGIYHVMARGNRKQVIFEDARDRRRFTRILAEASARYQVPVLGECRMGTHYHAVAKTPRANISEFMAYLNGEYAKYSNRRYQRTGHVFGERFVPVLVDTGLYLRVVMTYVLQNPVKAGLVDAAAEWKWSSYRATAGLEVAPAYLCLDWLDSSFPASSRSESRAMFEQYVNSQSLEDAEAWLQHVVYGSEACKKDVRAHIGATLYMAAIPRAYRALHRPPIENVLPFPLKKAERNTAMLRAHIVHAYTIAEIARCVGLHPASVSRIICSIRRLQTDL
jgi:putative transposase